MQVGSQTGAERQNSLHPAGHNVLDATQDMIGLLSCERTLLGHIKLLINQHPKGKTVYEKVRIVIHSQEK